jgi:fumarate reductase flavoprotein subunit
LPLLDAAMARPNATLLLRTEAECLLRDASGAVNGLRLRHRETGASSELYARHVVLASGGYAGNPELFARLTDGAPLYTPALSIASGSGIEMAEAIGARIRGGEHFIPTFAGIEEAEGKGRVLWDHLPSLTPQVRQPCELYVGPDGRRFVREDIDSVDARERALMRLPGLTFWVIFDDRILRDSPPLLPGWRAEELAEAWASSPSFAIADTVDELGRRAGIDAVGLAASLAEYNAALSEGVADPLGRVHRPCAIAPPYRAIRMHGIVLKTPAGLAVNTDLNVLDRNGAPISGLYAVGEAIGGATLSGNSFVGGMSVTPALSFGRWIGRELGRRHA